MLLLQFPELKQASGPVADVLRATRVEAEVLAAWDRLVEQEIQPRRTRTMNSESRLAVDGRNGLPEPTEVA